MNLTDNEIRVKCAEAMGWRAFENPKEVWYFYAPNTFPNGATAEYELPNFTTSVDAALTLCDRLRSEGWDVNLVLPRNTRDAIVELTRKKLVSPDFSIRDPSLARAICLAFLKVQDSVAR